MSILNKEQKRSVALLSIGTFLEYFDLMLYVHMAVMLNALFFPKTDPQASALLTAFAFSTTFVFRPIGAVLFGYIGDKYGRRKVIIITATVMALSCVLMANLPTYAQIGIYASILVTLCRALQGISSMGEVVAAELYLIETLHPIAQYVGVALITLCSVVGGTAALGVASLSTSFGFEWRIAFWIGALIALVGAFARTQLKETRDFLDPTNRIERSIQNAQKAEDIKNAAMNLQDAIVKRVNKTSMVCLFFMDYGWPSCMYFVYFYCASILQSKFAYTPEQIIHHNFIVSVFNIVKSVALVYLVAIFNPVKLIAVRAIGFVVFLISVPYLDTIITSPFHVMLLQAYVLLFALDMAPAAPITYKHFPVFRRFTCVGLSFSCARALSYVVTSFGMAYLVQNFSHNGLLIIFIPAAVGFIIGVMHFQKLEREIAIS